MEVLKTLLFLMPLIVLTIFSVLFMVFIGLLGWACGAWLKYIENKRSTS